MSHLIDMTGRAIGRLTVIAKDPRKGRARWRCRCACGAETVVLGTDLRRGATQSCGCLQREAASAASRRHGGSRPGPTRALYWVWQTMLQRCTNPKPQAYPRYGGRGIEVCERWRSERGFENFLADMGPRPTAAHSIERKDNNGAYSPDNCKWGMKLEQVRNMRTNRLLTLNGKTQTLAAWADELGVNYYTLHNRLRLGWSDADTLGTPVGGRRA